jgi:hypothetical protein
MTHVEYNWFRFTAVQQLLQLVGQNPPTEEQYALAEQIVDNISNYTRSRLGPK